MVSDGMIEGFVLQATYRIAAGRPVVLLAGRLENGASFLVRDRRDLATFWIPASATDLARGLGHDVVASAKRSMAGVALAEVVVGVPAEVPRVRRQLEELGVACLEADVPFATRALVRRGIRGSVRLRGRHRPAQGFDWVFDEPEIEPGTFVPTLRVLSLDIETNPRRDQLLSVALVGCGVREVFAVPPPGVVEAPAVEGVNVTLCADERAVLQHLVERVRVLDPDVLTGWSVVAFDCAQLVRFAARHRVVLALGRGPAPLRLRETRRGREELQAIVPGRLVLDGIEMLRGAFVTMPSYGLDAVAHEVLGVGKTLHGDDPVEAILQSWRHDFAGFVRYNSVDAELVLRILDHFGLVPLAVERSRLTGLTPDRVAASIASFDALYLGELGRRDLVAPSVAGSPTPNSEEAFGGHVLDPEPGLYEFVAVVDFRSLYPSVIRTFEIDPLGFLGVGAETRDAIVAPNGAAFRRAPRGILPGLLDELMPRRAAAIAAGDRTASQAIKILMNSFYGVLGTSACRFYEPAIAGAITAFGRELLLYCKAQVESWGYRVLYGDTDSLFVATGATDLGGARRIGAELPGRLDRALAQHVEATWGVESRLHLELDRLFLRLHLPSAREGGGARKRYAGLADKPAGPEVVLVGLEAVRSDWTDLARETQRELYRRWFADEPIEAWLAGVVDDLRAGRVDPERLVYRKRLRQPLDSYTSSAPPHVVAARLLPTPPRTVRYLVTTAGPQPRGHTSAPPDLEHYVQRQLRPVVEGVLAELDLEFDRVVGDQRQLRLF